MHRYVSYCTQIKANLTPTLLNTYIPLAFNYSLHCQYFHKKCIFSFLTSVQMFAEPNHAFFNKCISWGQVIPLYDILMTYWTEVPVWELISYKHFLFLYTRKYGLLSLSNNYWKLKKWECVIVILYCIFCSWWLGHDSIILGFLKNMFHDWRVLHIPLVPITMNRIKAATLYVCKLQ